MHSVWTVDADAARPELRRAAVRLVGTRDTGALEAGSTLRLVRLAVPSFEPGPAPARDDPVARRALALWPRLDRRALRRCRGDAARIARFVARRSSLPQDVIVGMLEAAPPEPPADPAMRPPRGGAERMPRPSALPSPELAR